MSNELRFSILVPVYNVEDYLKECIDSLVNQTFDEKRYEIIITNDGSTDNSSQICDEYVDKYENVFVIHQENRGLMLARRSGVEKAKGEYIIFVDSDDYVDSNMLEVIDNHLCKNNPDFLMHGQYRTYHDREDEDRVTQKCDEILTQMEFLRYFVSDDKYNSIACKAIRRELLSEHLDEVYRKVNLAEDMLQTSFITKYAKNIELISDCLYHYRIRTDSMVHNSTYDTILDAINVYEIAKKNTLDICEENRFSKDETEDLVLSSDAVIVNSSMDKIFRCNTCSSYSKSEKIQYLNTFCENASFKNIRKSQYVKKMKFYNILRYHILMSKMWNGLLVLDRMISIVYK